MYDNNEKLQIKFKQVYHYNRDIPFLSPIN